MLLRLSSQSKPSIHIGLLAGDKEEEKEKEGHHNSTGVKSLPRVFFGMEDSGSMEAWFSPHFLLPELRKRIGTRYFQH